MTYNFAEALINAKGGFSICHGVQNVIWNIEKGLKNVQIVVQH